MPLTIDQLRAIPEIELREHIATLDKKSTQALVDGIRKAAAAKGVIIK